MKSTKDQIIYIAFIAGFVAMCSVLVSHYSKGIYEWSGITDEKVLKLNTELLLRQDEIKAAREVRQQRRIENLNKTQ